MNFSMKCQFCEVAGLYYYDRRDFSLHQELSQHHSPRQKLKQQLMQEILKNQCEVLESLCDFPTDIAKLIASYNEPSVRPLYLFKVLEEFVFTFIKPKSRKHRAAFNQTKWKILDFVLPSIGPVNIKLVKSHVGSTLFPCSVSKNVLLIQHLSTLPADDTNQNKQWLWKMARRWKGLNKNLVEMFVARVSVLCRNCIFATYDVRRDEYDDEVISHLEDRSWDPPATVNENLEELRREFPFL